MTTYITITTTSDTIRVDFNDMVTRPDVNSYDASFKRSGLMQIFHNYSPEMIIVKMWDGTKWLLSLDGNNDTFPVTSIDTGDGSGAQVPSTMIELHNLLEELLLV